MHLGGRDAVRYAVPLRAGGSLWMIAFPDSKGWTTVACRSTSGRPDAACATVAATVRTRSAGAPLVLGPDKTIAAGVDRAIRRLNTARRTARPGLRSRSTASCARSFRTLASADQAAARTLAGLPLRPQEPALFEATVKALRAEAAILRRLARAARGRRRATFDSARGELRAAERRVRRAVGDLRADGYTAAS